MTEAAAVPCERCGTFLPGSPLRARASRVCAPCASLLRKQLPLYPYVYLNVVGMLLHFALAAVLSAINWRRLGDRERMWNASIVAVFGVLWLLAGLALGIRGGFLVLANIVGARVATQGLREPCEKHWRAGGTKANRLWPVLIAIGVLGGAVVLRVLLLLAASVHEEESY